MRAAPPCSFPSRFRFRAVCALIALILSGFHSHEAQTNAIIIPASMADAFGETGAAVFRDTQQIYPASMFAGVEQPEMIVHGMSFRLDESVSSLEVLVPTLSIYLSTMPRPFSTVSTIPGDNRGEDRMLVFSAQNLTLTAATPASPAQFDIRFLFHEPFLYDRRAGQLVMDFDNPLSLGEQLGLDATIPLGDEPGRLIVSGGWGPGVLVTEFLVTPIPEPLTVTLLTVGAFLLRKRLC